MIFFSSERTQKKVNSGYLWGSGDRGKLNFPPDLSTLLKFVISRYYYNVSKQVR